MLLACITFTDRLGLLVGERHNVDAAGLDRCVREDLNVIRVELVQPIRQHLGTAAEMIVAHAGPG